MHIPILFQILSPCRLLQNIEQFPVLYSRSLLVIYFKYGDVYISIPDSHFMAPSPPPFPFGNYKFIL